MTNGASPMLTSELMRDVYGFVVRPQHLQRCREYASVCKEEEELSQKWNSFLEGVAEYAQQSTSGLSEDRGSICSEVTATVKGAENGGYMDLEEEEISSGRKSGSFQNAVHEESNTSVRNSVDGLDKGVDEEDSSDRMSAEGPEKGVEKEDLSGRKSNDGLVKERPVRKEIKICTSQRWVQIRLSLAAIEHMMSIRVKEKVSWKQEPNTDIGNHLATINDSKDLDGDPEDKFSGDNANGPSGRISAQTSFPWKEELEVLVHGGVPMALRGEMWQAFVGVRARRAENYYQDLLSLESNNGECRQPDDATSDQTSEKPSINNLDAREKWKWQTEKDLPRTFPSDAALDEDGRNALGRLLTAYARHNPSVGYCQEINSFASLLLLLMPEESAFWALMGIIDDYFEGYCSEEMIESQVDQLVFEDLMRERFPKLVKHLDYLGVELAWVTGPWFLSIFANMLPWESVLRIWDVLLFEGNRAMLFRTLLALMDLYGCALVATKDAGDVVTLFKNLAGSTFEGSQLVWTACTDYRGVNEVRLQKLRDKHRPLVRAAEERSKEIEDSAAIQNGCVGSSSTGLDGFPNGLTGDSANDLHEQVVRHGTLNLYSFFDHGILLGVESRSTTKKLRKCFKGAPPSVTKGLKKDELYVRYLDSDDVNKILELEFKDKSKVAITATGGKARNERLWRSMGSLVAESTDIDDLAKRTNEFLKSVKFEGKGCELYMAGYSRNIEAYVVHHLGDNQKLTTHTSLGTEPHFKYNAIGSGASFALQSLKRHVRPPFTYHRALGWITRALINASVNDVSCGGKLQVVWLSKDEIADRTLTHPIPKSVIDNILEMAWEFNDLMLFFFTCEKNKRMNYFVLHDCLDRLASRFPYCLGTIYPGWNMLVARFMKRRDLDDVYDRGSQSRFYKKSMRLITLVDSDQTEHKLLMSKATLGILADVRATGFKEPL